MTERKTGGRPPIPENEDITIETLYERGMPKAAIARMLGRCEGTIRRALARRGIVSRKIFKIKATYDQIHQIRKMGVEVLD